MGSLASRPKVPATVQPQIITITQPAPTSVSDSSSTSQSSVTNDSGSDGNTLTSDSGTDTGIRTNSDTEVRITNLLRRNRGITGTIQTGFRGLLSANGLVPQRKTLLGE